MRVDKLKDKLKLFMILEVVLILVIFIISLIVNFSKGNSITTSLNVYYYSFGVIVMVTAIPSLYRRPYSQKGVYRKMIGGMFSFKKTGYETLNVESKGYEDESPFVTGLFIVFGGALLLLIGFALERIFNII